MYDGTTSVRKRVSDFPNSKEHGQKTHKYKLKSKHFRNIM